MSVKSIVLLLLLSITVTQVTACDGDSQHHMCNSRTRPMSCTRIRVNKSKVTYQLMIILCASNQCTENNITINFKCCDICEACRILTDIDCAHEFRDLVRWQRENKCEHRVDTVVSGYCSKITSATTHAPLTSAFHSTMPMSSSAKLENGSRASASKSDEDMNSTTLGLGIALGVLFCLSVLLLATVTIGWVCTCRYVMRKRDAKMSTGELKGVSTSDSEEERYLRNPVYNGTASSSSTGAPAVAAYDVVANTPSQSRNGQMYNILNRGQATGQTMAVASQSTGPGAGRDYSQLGPRDGEHGNK